MHEFAINSANYYATIEAYRRRGRLIFGCTVTRAGANKANIYQFPNYQYVFWLQKREIKE